MVHNLSSISEVSRSKGTLLTREVIWFLVQRRRSHSSHWPSQEKNWAWDGLSSWDGLGMILQSSELHGECYLWYFPSPDLSSTPPAIITLAAEWFFFFNFRESAVKPCEWNTCSPVCLASPMPAPCWTQSDTKEILWMSTWANEWWTSSTSLRSEIPQTQEDLGSFLPQENSILQCLNTDV